MADDSALFTQIRVTLIEKDSLRATATCKVAGAIYLTGIRVIEGKNGLFISMPSNKSSAGEVHDVYFAASRDIREALQEEVLKEYRKELELQRPPQGPPQGPRDVTDEPASLRRGQSPRQLVARRPELINAIAGTPSPLLERALQLHEQVMSRMWNTPPRSVFRWAEDVLNETSAPVVTVRPDQD